MSVLVSDHLQKMDCTDCGVSQKQFDDLCASCHFRNKSNEKLEKILAEENDFVIRFWARVLAWALVAALSGLLIFLVSLWK